MSRTQAAQTIESPTVAERVVETRQRIDSLKAERGRLGLAASKGDAAARKSLGEVVTELQTAEIELAVLIDAGDYEQAENLRQAAAADLTRRFDGLKRAEALLVTLGKQTETVVLAQLELDKARSKADEMGSEIRDLLWEASRSENGAMHEQPAQDTVNEMCRPQCSTEDRRYYLNNARQRIDALRLVLAKAEEPSEPETMRLGAKAVYPD